MWLSNKICCQQEVDKRSSLSSKRGSKLCPCFPCFSCVEFKLISCLWTLSRVEYQIIFVYIFFLIYFFIQPPVPLPWNNNCIKEQWHWLWYLVPFSTLKVAKAISYASIIPSSSCADSWSLVLLVRVSVMFHSWKTSICVDQIVVQYYQGGKDRKLRITWS